MVPFNTYPYPPGIDPLFVDMLLFFAVIVLAAVTSLWMAAAKMPPTFMSQPMRYVAIALAELLIVFGALWCLTNGSLYDVAPSLEAWRNANNVLGWIVTIMTLIAPVVLVVGLAFVLPYVLYQGSLKKRQRSGVQLGYV